MPVYFNFQKKATLKDRTRLKTFIVSIFKKEKRLAGDINFVFCSDEYILQVNQSFLQHDYYTDIITFDLSESGEKAINAEIYISVDTVKSNAIQFNTTFSNELHRVIFHGILHLCGYKDKRKSDQIIMRQKENYYLKAYFKN